MDTIKKITRWIECGVSPGMFSDERTVEVSDRTFFVLKKSVRNVTADGRGEVEVTIVERDGQKWAVLPTNTRETVPVSA